LPVLLFIKERLIIYSRTFPNINLFASFVISQAPLALTFISFRHSSCCISDHKPTTDFTLHTAVN
jgi:hypothetical protein